jgi:hypothetical protein
MRLRAKALGALFPFSLILVPFRSEAQEAVREPVPHLHVISGNPLLLLAEWFNGEYERKLKETLTVGISGGWLNLGEDTYSGVVGFLRYYPQEAAFTGFYLGGRGGPHNVDEGEESHTALGIGVDVGYAWLLGPSQSFYVGLGIGATRLFGDLGDAPTFIPSLRLINVGVAF